MERGTTGSDDPELAINAEWCAEMRAARLTAGLSQEVLADKIGSTQNAISLVERGLVGSSHVVMPVCRLLKINPPTFLVDEDERRWVRLGRELRSRSEASFMSAMTMVEALVAAIGGPGK